MKGKRDFYSSSIQRWRVAYACILGLLMLFNFSKVYSQEWVMPVDGKVYSKDSRLAGAVITLFKNGQQIQQVVTTNNGKFSFELPANAEYIISVTKAGYITKKFKIVTANVPPMRAEAGGFNPFEPDITLFEMPNDPEISKRVEAILSQPIAIYQYDTGQQNFDYDPKYTQAMQDKLAELAQLQKRAEKAASEGTKTAAIEAQKQLEIDNKYKAAITKGDNAFASKDYTTAKSSYKEASGIKISEAYPKNKIVEIDKLLANAGKQKELDAKYQAAISKGDNAFASKDYVTAKSAYTEASGIKPAEVYPKNKIVEIDKLLANAGKQKELDAKYQAAISKGDNAFASKDYSGAIVLYTQAVDIKPSETYPKTKLDEIKKILAELDSKKSAAEKEQQYKDLIAKGDNSFSSKEYTTAQTAYLDASALKPTEQYPKKKLAEIDKILAALEVDKQKELRYKELIDMGDKQFAQKDYASAKTSFTQALDLKSDQYPKNKIAEIDKLLKDITAQSGENALEANYQKAIKNGDASFKNENYSMAKSAYNEALSYKPKEQYPKDKLAEIARIEKEQAGDKDKDARYRRAIAKADQAFTMKNYVLAKSGYGEASVIKPNENYPKDRIKQIDELLKKSPQTVVAKTKEPAETSTQPVQQDPQKTYQDELRAQFPEGITEEEFIDNGKRIIRRVVIKKEVAAVYVKVIHSWGGVYCFKDNKSITEVMFDNESR